MTASVVPEDGELQFGPVRLPACRRVTPFCDECADQGLRTVREIAPVLVDQPIWTFWWD